MARVRIGVDIGATAVRAAELKGQPPSLVRVGQVVSVTHLIDHPDATPDDLMQFVKGPDFPTGGYILGRAGIMDAYRTGRGSIRMRAVAEIEERKKDTVIVVSALPYQTSTGSIAGRIKELVDSRELEGIREVNDESAGETTKLVITLKRDANANVILNNLLAREKFRVVPWLVIVTLAYGATLLGVANRLAGGEILSAFKGIVQILGCFSALLLGVSIYFTWHKEGATVRRD